MKIIYFRQTHFLTFVSGSRFTIYLFGLRGNFYY